MAVLPLDEVPQDVYERIEQSAAAHHHTFTAEVIRLLRQGLRKEDEETRAAHAAALANLRHQRWTPPTGAPDSVALLREDRTR
jgi:plasmid stability protein